MFNFSGIRRSIELPIGSRFYFWDCLYEVVELEDNGWGCSQCALAGDEAICEIMKCKDYRYDGKGVFFKEVEQSKEEKQ